MIFSPCSAHVQGKTPKCLPTSVKFPSDWSLSYSANHWSNEQTNEYLKKVILPYYVVKKREELHLKEDHQALVIFDCFKAQCTEEVFKVMESHHISYALVPANCMDCLQPLDLSVNKLVKNFLQAKFQTWYYSEQVARQLSDEKQDIEPVDLRLSVVKPLGAKWMIELLFDHLKQHPEIIKNGFSAAAGISECLKN